MLLKPGDLLYIPCGYWHKAEGLGAGGSGLGGGASGDPSPQPPGPSPHEAAISLAIGVMSRTAMDVYDFLRNRLMQSLVWRQRLPLPTATSHSRAELEETYRHLFRQLADDFAKTLGDPQLIEEFLHSMERCDNT